MSSNAPDIRMKQATDVRSMFDSIAPKYDLTNTVLSFGMHYYWRKVLVRMLPRAANLQVLDLCTGTGDLLPLLEERFAAAQGKVTGADFSQQMLVRAAEKWPGRFKLMQADALSLPFAESSFDIVSVAFGVRNFEDLERGLREIKRVLKPGGSALILEFGQPTLPVFSTLYRLYSRFLMPLIGGVLTGNKAAYSYLPKTAQRFPCGREFSQVLEGLALKPIKVRSLMFGIAYCYQAQRTA